MTAKLRGLIVTVGGSPDPIKETIEEKKPEYILFVASEESWRQVDSEILPVSYSVQHETLTLTNYENIGTCYREIRDGAREWLERRGLSDDEVYVDNTGGTKIMSSALVLAGVERFSAFAYVGGKREGLGIVLDGTETVITSQNPWNQYAARDLERANWLLAESHAHAAADLLNEAAGRCDAEFKNKIKGFANLARALGEADMFRFGKSGASGIFNRARGGLEYTLDYTTFQRLATLSDCGWRRVDDQIRADGKTPGRETLLELLANAERRAKQSRYDDAAGRLYRAVELRGQQLMRQAFGAELGKPRLDDFPANRRADAQALLGEPDEDGRYKIGVQKLYAALAFCEEKSLREQGEAYERLKDHLSVRNNSLLAHGLNPVKEDHFAKFWQDALDVMGVQESEIPRWPTLNLTL